MERNPAISGPLSPSMVERVAVLLAACLTALSVPLSVTAPAVALPAIRLSLGASPEQLAWVINGYLLTFGSCVLVAGGMADRYGRRRCWLVGIGLFVLSTIAVTAVTDPSFIVAARLFQGACAALAMAGSSATLAQMFEGPAQARAFSLIGTSFGAALAFGPLMAGWLIERYNWMCLFYVAALIAALAFVLVSGFTRSSEESKQHEIAWLDAAIFTAAMSLFTYAVLRIPEHGWANLQVLISFAIAALLFFGFLRRELKAASPLLDLKLFADSRFVGVQLLAFSLAFIYVVPVLLLPQRFIGIEGFSELAAGKLMICLSAPLLVIPPLAGWVSRRVDTGLLAGFGLGVASLGMGWLAIELLHGRPEDAWDAMLVIGVGIGLPWGVVDGLAIKVVPADRAGMAAGIFNTVRVTADGMAVALVSMALALSLQYRLAAATPTVEPELLRQAAATLGTGSLDAAPVRFLGLPTDTLVQLYRTSFSHALWLLAGFGMLSAIAVGYLLWRRNTGGPEVMTDLGDRSPGLFPASLANGTLPRGAR